MSSLHKIRLGHSPDPDDAFMFYPLLSGKVACDGIEFQERIEPIHDLNELALSDELDFTAASAHAYVHLADSFRMLSSGASMGDGYGPVLVAKEKGEPEDFIDARIALPGKSTTAYLLLKFVLGRFHSIEVPFEKVTESLKGDEAEAALLIHEGQITYEKEGFVKILDLGEWWKKETGLPVPLGVNLISRKLDEETQKKIAQAFQASVQYALDNPTEALAHAKKYSRGLSDELNEKFVKMYVNQWTLDMGEEGRKAHEELYRLAVEKSLIAKAPPLDLL